MKKALPYLLLLVLLLPATAEEPAGENWLEEVSELLRDYEYRAAEKILLRVIEDDPENYDAVLRMARAAAGVGEYPRAKKLYLRAWEIEPDRPDPPKGIASMALRLDRRDLAREWYEKALAKNPEHATSLAGLARIAIEDKDFGAADAYLVRAEASSPHSATVLGTRAEYWFRLKDMTQATKLLRRVLEVSPRNMGAHQRLSNGFLELDRLPYRPPSVPADYDRAVRTAIESYAIVDLDAAESAFAALDTDRAPDGRPPFYRGLIALRLGEVRRAADFLWRAVEKEPDAFLYRNALAAAYRFKVARQRAEYGGGEDPTDRVTALAEKLFPAEVPGVSRIVRGYDRLLPGERAVIARAARPFARYLDTLATKRVTHDILGFEEGTCDASEREYLKTRRTHDGRWYGALRGVGGRNAATGIEAVLTATGLRYDTFAHELAHQVHVYAFSEADKAVVLRLYRGAMASDLCLDYYAASNDREYFAQGYEAFISPVKSPYHHSLRRHDRAELLARDPALYRFIARVTGTPEPDPAVAKLAPRILEFYEWSGDPIRLERAKILFARTTAPAGSPERR